MLDDLLDLELREPQLTKDHTQTLTPIGMVELTSMNEFREPHLTNEKNASQEQLGVVSKLA